MPTTDSLTNQPDTTRPDPRTETTTSPGTPGNSRPQRPRIDGAPARNATSTARVGVAFAITAAIAVGALVWAVISGPADTSVDPSTHDRVELNRAGALRDLASESAGSYDRVELNRAGVLRDLASESAGSYDRVELNRAGVLRDLASEPAGSYDRVELNRAGVLRDLVSEPSE